MMKLQNITDIQQQKIEQYIELLMKWNRVFKLTAITAKDEIIDKHIADGLSIVKYCQDYFKDFVTENEEQNILDLGSGMGVPGIILAIMMPDTKITLLDSNSKKTAFLLQVKIELKLDNVSVLHMRAQECPEKFALVVTRAFASCDKIIEIAQTLLTPSGSIFAMKSAKFQEELDALPDTIKTLWNYKIIPILLNQSDVDSNVTRCLLTFQRKSKENNLS